MISNEDGGLISLSFTHLSKKRIVIYVIFSVYAFQQTS